MSGEPSDFADFEAKFPGCAEIVERNVAEAPRLSPEQLLRGLPLFATFRVPPRTIPAEPDEEGPE
ncbi:hypothetical protein [Streptomyces fagopyri]